MTEGVGEGDVDVGCQDLQGIDGNGERRNKRSEERCMVSNDEPPSCEEQNEQQRTSSPSSISLKATTSIPFPSPVWPLPPQGKTTTAFGQQEWLKSAIVGEMETPIGVREGEERVKVFVVNCVEQRTREGRDSESDTDVALSGERKEGKEQTAAHKSSTSPTLSNPNKLISAGATPLPLPPPAVPLLEAAGKQWPRKTLSEIASWAKGDGWPGFLEEVVGMKERWDWREAICFH